MGFPSRATNLRARQALNILSSRFKDYKHPEAQGEESCPLSHTCDHPIGCLDHGKLPEMNVCGRTPMTQFYGERVKAITGHSQTQIEVKK